MTLHSFRFRTNVLVNAKCFILKKCNFSRSMVAIIVLFIKVILIRDSECEQTHLKSDQIENYSKSVKEDTNSNLSSETTNEDPSLPYVISSTYLTKLAVTEQIVYEELKQYAKESRDRLELVEAYLKDYEQTTGRSTIEINSRSEEAATNPLLAYRMISRFVHEFDSFKADVILKWNLEAALLSRMKDLSNSIQEFPSPEGLEEATEALLLVQHFYNLTSNDLRRGFIYGKDAGVGLTPDQCYEITEHAVSKELYYLAFEWLDTMDSIINEADPANVPLDLPGTLADMKNWLVRRHDDKFETNKARLNKYMFDEKLSENPNGQKLKDVILKKYRDERNHGIFGAYEISFMDLCNGHDHRTEYEKSKLYCWLEWNSHPFFTIGPMKMELLSTETYLVRIYEVMTDNWLQILRNTGLPGLARVPPIQKALRSALYSLLKDEPVPLGQRVESIFNIRAAGEKASDYLQVATYGFGGNVGTHHDYMGYSPFIPRSPSAVANNPTLKAIGERLSTFLLYLNDVEEGGYTAFPIIGTYVEPIKGSAIFWYNALRNGKLDVKTLHGACPVLWGHKWIATKWSHQFENFLKRPCATDPDL